MSLSALVLSGHLYIENARLTIVELQRTKFVTRLGVLATAIGKAAKSQCAWHTVMLIPTRQVVNNPIKPLLEAVSQKNKLERRCQLLIMSDSIDALAHNVDQNLLKSIRQQCKKESSIFRLKMKKVKRFSLELQRAFVAFLFVLLLLELLKQCHENKYFRN